MRCLDIQYSFDPIFFSNFKFLLHHSTNSPKLNREKIKCVLLKKHFAKIIWIFFLVDFTFFVDKLYEYFDPKYIYI